MRWSKPKESGASRTSAAGGRKQQRFVRRLLCVALGAALVLPFLPLLIAQPDGQRVITFYTGQTAYSLPVLDRNNSEYVGLLEALEPMGNVSAKADGKKWKLKFRDIEGQFEEGKNKAKVRGNTLELAAPFVLENGRGAVPLRSLRQILAAFVPVPVEFHEASRRMFIGANVVRVSARRIDSGKVAFTFSAPVNPVIATEPGRLRMSFRREPLLGEPQPMSFDDKIVPSALYSESNGAADLTVIGTAPLLATFSDDRKTITVAPVPVVAPPASVQVPLPSAPTAPQPAQAQVARPRPRTLVIIDAAHGGDDRGATLTDKIVEKDITLALGRRLRHELLMRGVETAMVRDGDNTVAIDERARIANASQAALYVALHAAGTGSGVHLYAAMIAPQTRKPLGFVLDTAAQAGFIASSRAVLSAMSTELLRRDVQTVSLPAAVPPLNHVASAAIAVEVAPPGGGTAADLASSTYQQSVAVALANAISAAQSRFPEVAR